MGDKLKRCETCDEPCHFEHRLCPKHGGPPLTTWKDSLSPRQQTHMAFCLDYSERYDHGAPGHLDYTLIADLVRLLDSQSLRIPSGRQVVAWDVTGNCFRDVVTGVRVDIESGIRL